MQVVPAQLLRRHKKESLVRVIWVSDFEMRKLNRQFRGKDKVTDVLSFSCDEPGVLGELVLSWSQIRRQAHEFQVLASDEALFLILHGYLHLLGMDHERGERQARKMFAIQLGLLEILRPDAKGLKDGAFHRVI